MENLITVGLVQAAPVFNDLDASTEKAVELIKSAASKGSKIVAFGECWLAGYPAWLDHSPNAALWNYEPTKCAYAEMRRNSLVVGGRETKVLAEAARINKVTVVIGTNERVDRGLGNGTIYNALLTFGDDGTLVNHHRKLVPTYSERLVHGNGDGDGLRVVETNGIRLGGLICWEHFMPLARQSMHEQGEQIHVALFPTVHELHQLTSRQYAFEGRCFVLAIGSILSATDLPAALPAGSEIKADDLILSGGSCIIAPDGSFLVKPTFDIETIITAEIDLRQIDRESMTLDVSGHSLRSDVFNFSVNKTLRARSF
jgi:predicted amidohydrolase